MPPTSSLSAPLPIYLPLLALYPNSCLELQFIFLLLCYVCNVCFLAFTYCEVTAPPASDTDATFIRLARLVPLTYYFQKLQKAPRHEMYLRGQQLGRRRSSPNYQSSSSDLMGQLLRPCQNGREGWKLLRVLVC